MKFDNILGKAKDVFEAAYKKADNAISVQKQRFDIVGLENKLSKDYETLGMLCYEEMKRGAFNDNGEFIKVADAIGTKRNQIEELKKEIQKARAKKRCPKCNALIEKSANFCNVCGEKISEE